MSAMKDIYICDAHGVGYDECCQHGENAGWMESLDPADCDEDSK